MTLSLWLPDIKIQKETYEMLKQITTRTNPMPKKLLMQNMCTFWSSNAKHWIQVNLYPRNEKWKQNNFISRTHGKLNWYKLNVDQKK